MLRPSLIAGCVLCLALPVLTAAAQQDNSSQPQQSPPPAQTNKPAPAKKDAPKKTPGQENPFPEEQSKAAAQPQHPGSTPDAPQPKDQAAPQSKPQAPAPSGSQAKPSTADENPFPEEQSRKAAHEDQPTDKPAPDTAAPAQDDPSFSSSHVKGLDMPTVDEAPTANLPPSPLPYDPKLAKKDAYVGDYYMESGNWKGAYDRFLEANRSDPGNAEAVFGLGESARHLHQDDVAIRNFRLYLSALPYGPHAKEVHKALKEMGVEH